MKKQKPTIVTQPVTNITFPNPIPRDYRRELWIGVAIALAGSVNCIKKESPGLWAAKALEDYDKTFNNSIWL